ncbi:hypothetical protein BC938DRAFT_471217 [Jimgerdemannia flammicorona]|uniref:J domain-containing protein n=1 Tax=Jimgerdemannia flammicorona TaxID=994334 RepID=A0A433QUR4_9FUNG|nr:hypothetical protein BC938DRAFT_471217 [Jimgerdemannia flammicorona]
MGDMFGTYAGMFAWAFIPNFATGMIQSFYYTVTYPVDHAKPQPGSNKWRRHHRNIYTLVVVSYLLYTIWEANASLGHNYYTMLGVGSGDDFSAKQLKTSFYKLSREFHPDKNPSAIAGQIFIHLRKAYETLNDPIKRAAYDKFGPAVEDWQHVLTLRDYMLHGLSGAVSFYLGTGLILVVFNILGKGQFGKFWRLVVFFALACLEFSMLVSPTPFILSGWLYPYRTTYQQIALLHQLFITVSIALSQVGPVLFPSESQDIRPMIEQVELLSHIAAAESLQLTREAFAPFARDEVAQTELKRKMEKMAVDLNLLNDPNYQQMYNHWRRIAPKVCDGNLGIASNIVSMDKLPTEILVRILILSHKPTTLGLCQRVCKRFDGVIADASFKASWLILSHGPRSLAVVFSNALTLKHSSYRWFLTEEVVLLLISRGIDIHIMNDLPLVWAADSGHKELFALLLNAYDPSLNIVERNELSFLLRWSEMKMSAYCKSSMIDYPNSRYYTKNDDPNMDISKSALNIALHTACAAGNREVVRMILDGAREDQRLRINSMQCFALRVSLASARFDIVDLLLAHGARRHFELLDICFRNVTTGKPANTPIYRDLFVRFYFCGVRSKVQWEDELLRRMQSAAESLGWWPILKRMAAGRRADPRTIAHLALQEILSSRPDRAVAILGRVPVRQRYLRLLKLVARWLCNPMVNRIDYGQVVAFAVRLQHVGLLRALVANDARDCFKLPWVIQCAYAEEPDGGLEKMFLARWGLTRTKADAVIRTTETIKGALAEYMRNVPHANATTCLNRLVAAHVRHGRVRVVEMMIAAGGNVDAELDEIFSHFGVADPANSEASIFDDEANQEGESEDEYDDEYGDEYDDEPHANAHDSTRNVSSSIQRARFDRIYSDRKVLSALITFSKLTLDSNNGMPTVFRHKFLFPPRNFMLATLLNHTHSHKPLVLRIVTRLDPYALTRLLTDNGDPFLRTHAAEILAMCIQWGGRDSLNAVLSVRRFVEVVKPMGLTSVKLDHIAWNMNREEVVDMLRACGFV